MKRIIYIGLILFFAPSYQHTYPVLNIIEIYGENTPKKLYPPINSEVLKWQEKYYHSRIQYKQILHEVGQKNKKAWSLFQIAIHQIKEENKKTLLLVNKKQIKQLNHERWFQNFLYTSLFTFGIITYKTLINN